MVNNPFEAAIEVLQDKADNELYVQSLEDAYRAAIRVLEAAGMVDRRDLGRIHMGFVSAEMRELLEAIRQADAALTDRRAIDVEKRTKTKGAGK